MQSIAQAWLVLKLTNSSLMLGVVSFAAYMPIVVVALFAGVVVDHVDRRRLIIAAQTLLMLTAFVLTGLTWSGVVQVHHVIVIATINGLVSSFEMPARQTFVVEMVGREDLANAIAMNSMIFNGARMIGPALAGMLIAIIGVGGCFFFNGLSFLAVIWGLLLMDVPTRPRTDMAGAMLRRVREGLRYVWQHQSTRWLLIIVAINSGFAVQYAVLTPIFARDILHAGARGFGFLTAAQGLGAVIGAIIMNSRPATPKVLRNNLVFGLFCMSASIAAFGMSRSMPLSIACQMLIGVGMMNHMVTTNMLLQMFVSDELRGRVMSVYTLSFIGTAPIGSLAVGFVGEHLSPAIAVSGCAAIGFACAILLTSKLKVIARSQEEIEQAEPA